MIPTIGPRAQSRQTIPRPTITKPKKKRGIKNPVPKKPKTTTAIPIVYLTGEAD